MEQALLMFEDAAAQARRQAIDELHIATALYTSEPIVDALLDRLRWPCGNASLLDTSAGDGMFLGRALDRLLAARSISDEEIPRLIEGQELHGHACAEARARLTSLLIGHGRSGTRAAALARRVVHERDFITEGPTRAKADFLVGNPPYIRMLSVPALLREEYVARAPAYARGDLMHAFLARCADMLVDGGRIAMVLSDRFLFNETAAPLREALGRNLSIQHVERLDPKTSFFRPKLRKAGTPPRIHPVAVIRAAGRATPDALANLPRRRRIEVCRPAHTRRAGDCQDGPLARHARHLFDI